MRTVKRVLIVVFALLVPSASWAMSLTDVLRLHAAGKSDEEIAGMVDAERAQFVLSPSNVAFLRGRGLSDALITALRATTATPPPSGEAGEEPHAEEPQAPPVEEEAVSETAYAYPPVACPSDYQLAYQPDGNPVCVPPVVPAYPYAYGYAPVSYYGYGGWGWGTVWPRTYHHHFHGRFSGGFGHRWSDVARDRGFRPRPRGNWSRQAAVRAVTRPSGNRTPAIRAGARSTPHRAVSTPRGGGGRMSRPVAAHRGAHRR